LVTDLLHLRWLTLLGCLRTRLIVCHPGVAPFGRQWRRRLPVGSYLYGPRICDIRALSLKAAPQRQSRLVGSRVELALLLLLLLGHLVPWL
jgi:hypothetical protein